MKIRALARKDIKAMSKLLAYRHQLERSVYNSLNVLFEDEKKIEPLISSFFDEKLSISIGAFEGEELLGFISSTIKTDTLFGRCAWVKYDGLALAEAVDPSLYRDLYAHIAEKWLELGCLKHFVIIPAGQIFIKILKNLNCNQLIVPKIGLSDGMIHQLHSKHKKK